LRPSRTLCAGAKAGQELKAEVIYPADYASPSWPQDRCLQVDVKAIKKRTLPELNDEFAKEIGAYESMPTWKPVCAGTWPFRKKRSVEGETKDRLFARSLKIHVPGGPNRWCRSR